MVHSQSTVAQPSNTLRPHPHHPTQQARHVGAHSHAATRGDPFAHRGRAVKSVVFNGTFPIDEPLTSRYAVDAEAAGDSASDYDEYDDDEEPDDGLGDYEMLADEQRQQEQQKQQHQAALFNNV